jgi:hypothetical protein
MPRGHLCIWTTRVTELSESVACPVRRTCHAAGMTDHNTYLSLRAGAVRYIPRQTRCKIWDGWGDCTMSSCTAPSRCGLYTVAKGTMFGAPTFGDRESRYGGAEVVVGVTQSRTQCLCAHTRGLGLQSVQLDSLTGPVCRCGPLQTVLLARPCASSARLITGNGLTPH